MIIMNNNFNNELLWVTFYTLTGKVYYITSDTYRRKYFLWKTGKSNPSKTKYESEDPTELYKYCKG